MLRSRVHHGFFTTTLLCLFGGLLLLSTSFWDPANKSWYPDVLWPDDVLVARPLPAYEASETVLDDLAEPISDGPLVELQDADITKERSGKILHIFAWPDPENGEAVLRFCVHHQDRLWSCSVPQRLAKDTNASPILTALYSWGYSITAGTEGVSALYYPTTLSPDLAFLGFLMLLVAGILDWLSKFFKKRKSN